MKKRTKSQRLGDRGELAFSNAASRVGMIPTKVSNDYGLDFLCMTEQVTSPDKTSEITGNVIGVAVRSTASQKGKVRFKKEDINYLLSCKLPVFLALVHIRGKSEDIYVRLLDEELAMEFANILDSGQNEITFRPSAFQSYEKIPELLKIAQTHGFINSINIAIVSSGLARVLPDVKIELRVNSSGSYSLVRTREFFSQFIANQEESRQALRLAAFGSPRFMKERIINLQLKQDIYKHVKKLPQPVIISGQVVEKEIRLIAEGSAGIAECTFRSRLADNHLGYVHKSGFSIQFSEAKPHKGKIVHWINVQIDPDDDILLCDYPDLDAFLRMCIPGQKWGNAEDDHRYPVEDCNQLPLYGSLAHYLRQASRIAPWLLKEISLSEAKSEESLNTLALAGQLSLAPESLSGLGWTMIDQQSVTEEKAKVLFSTIGNIRENGLVFQLNVDAILFLSDEQIAGFKIVTINEVSIKKANHCFDKKSSYPELVIKKNWPVIQLGPEPKIGSLAPSDWGCEAIIISQNQD